ncbi:unnamed protein product [Adineta steineri]|uniref:Uncharacterized protein n=1 Tax=Adineta steineri TaxID=433720 RepID=A0A818Z4S2_9BILA|nr:unnamed protein product [Adineta steineri]CAF3872673.1 unnamed protein product [Adineta steineri]
MSDEQLIRLSEEATDETTIDPYDMSDQQINTRIAYPRNYFKEIIISHFGWIFNFFHRCINQFLHLLIFSKNYIITHLFGPYDKQYDIESYETQPGYSELPYPLYRDAEAEGRTAHPANEPVIFSLTTMNVEITDAEYINVYEDNIHVNVNNIAYTEPVLNNGNDNLIPPNPQNGSIDRDINNEDIVSEDAIDNPTCNINPVRSVESEDNLSASDSSDNECTGSCESGFDSDDEGEISDGDLHTGAVLQVNDDVHTNVQDNSLSNGENLIHEQATTTGTSSNEVIETIENITTPTEGGAYSDIIPPIQSPKVMVPKSSNNIHSNDGLEEESAI